MLTLVTEKSGGLSVLHTLMRVCSFHLLPWLFFITIIVLDPTEFHPVCSISP